MPLTNFPHGISSFGVPVLGSIGGIPFTGNYWFVDPASGADGNSGNSPSSALQTLDRAHTLATDGNNDVVVLIGDGTTTATARQSSTLTWSKNATHLVGVAAPSMYAQRARISTATGATANLAPLMTVSGNGCMFANFSFFQGVGEASTDEKLIDITGSRNYFYNVQFGGMGSANGAARAGSYVISLSGGENLFEHCAIGLETQARSAANASVKLSGSSAQRNEFRDCEFQMYPTASSPLFLDASTSGVLNGSTMQFKRCAFRALMNATSSTQPSVTATVHAAVNGTIYFDNCSTVAAKWAAATTEIKVTGPASNGFSGGVFANAADS